MSFNELIEKIESGFRGGSIAVWCGAGVSMPSGLPGAQQLVKEILAVTHLTTGERGQIEASVFGVPGKESGQLPFERFMEVVLDTMDEAAQNNLLKLFTLGQPSLYHRFLARLAKLGMLKTIYTTNFDLHIETALCNEDLKRGENFEVCYDYQNFGKIDWQGDIIRVIKLHGSVDELNKLAVTVRSVATPGSVQQVIEPVKHLFDNGNHTCVLFLGYSFSDRFDLSPAIFSQGKKDCNKLIVNLKYTSKDDKEFKIYKYDNIDQNNKKGIAHPLTLYSNKYHLFGNTEKVINILCESLGLKDIKSDSTSDIWSSFVRKFFEELDSRYRGISGYLIGGSLLTMISADNQALKYFKMVKLLADETKNTQSQLVALQCLAGCQIKIGDRDNALKNLKEVGSFAAQLKEGKFSDHVNSQLGSLYNQIGSSCFQHALQYFNTALEVAKQGNDYLRCVPHLAGIAECWMKLGDFDAAKKAYTYALSIVENSGDLYRKAEVYGNIASMAYIIRDYKSAIDWYDKARKTSSLCGDIEREGIHTMNIANVYVKLKRYEDAFGRFTEVRKLLEGIWVNHPILQMLNKHEQQAKRWSEENHHSSTK